MKLSDHERKVLRARSRLWATSPSAFSRDVFGIDPWKSADPKVASQSTILDSLPFTRLCAWRSGHKVGKSTTAAIIALWCWVFWPGVRVVLTAPTGRQIERVVWREVTRLYRLAAKRGFALGGQLYKTYSKGLVRFDAAGVPIAEVFGMSTDDPDRFSGVSGAYVVYIVDEGSGVEDTIWQAIFGNAMSGAYVWTFGNPTRNEGQFFRAFHEESHAWRTFHTSSEHVAPLNIRGLANRSTIELMQTIWSPHDTHPLYAIRVLGEFAGMGTAAIFSLTAWEAARKRYDHGSDFAWMDKQLVLGVDVARFGDDSCAITARRGDRVCGPTLLRGGLDSHGVAGWVRETALDLLGQQASRIGHGVEKPRVQIDVIGIGAGAFDVLHHDHDDLFETYGVNVAEASQTRDDYYENLRAQLWFGAAEWVGKSAELADDSRLRSDLLAPTYGYSKRGRLLVEPKDKLKMRIGRSPDAGDSLTLCAYEPPAWSSAGAKLPGLNLKEG